MIQITTLSLQQRVKPTSAKLSMASKMAIWLATSTSGRRSSPDSKGASGSRGGLSASCVRAASRWGWDRGELDRAGATALQAWVPPLGRGEPMLEGGDLGWGEVDRAGAAALQAWVPPLGRFTPMLEGCNGEANQQHAF